MVESLHEKSFQHNELILSELETNERIGGALQRFTGQTLLIASTKDSLQQSLKQLRPERRVVSIDSSYYPFNTKARIVQTGLVRLYNILDSPLRQRILPAQVFGQIVIKSSWQIPFERKNMVASYFSDADIELYEGLSSQKQSGGRMRALIQAARTPETSGASLSYAVGDMLSNIAYAAVQAMKSVPTVDAPIDVDEFFQKPRAGWRTEAACYGLGIGLANRLTAPRVLEEVREFCCGGCPVRRDCLMDTILNTAPGQRTHGAASLVPGGLTTKEFSSVQDLYNKSNATAAMERVMSAWGYAASLNR